MPIMPRKSPIATCRAEFSRTGLRDLYWISKTIYKLYKKQYLVPPH